MPALKAQLLLLLSLVIFPSIAAMDHESDMDHNEKRTSAKRKHEDTVEGSNKKNKVEPAANEIIDSETAQQLLAYIEVAHKRQRQENAKPSPILLQFIQATGIRQAQENQGVCASFTKKLLENQGACASFLFEQNTEIVIPQDQIDPKAAIVYPQHTIFTYAVGRPDILNALKANLNKINDELRLITSLGKDCSGIVAQYITPIETGLISQIHYADIAKINFETITPNDKAKGVLTALALRYFTKDTTIKASLTAIAKTLLTTESANYCYTNEQGKQVGPALHIAVLSDRADSERYIDPQATQETTLASSAAAAAKPSSIIQELIAYGANEQATDANGKTAKQLAVEILAPPALRRQHATARASMFGWMH